MILVLVFSTRVPDEYLSIEERKMNKILIVYIRENEAVICFMKRNANVQNSWFEEALYI